MALATSLFAITFDFIKFDKGDMNEFQVLTYSASLTVLASVWLFFGVEDNDDNDGQKMIPLRQDAR